MSMNLLSLDLDVVHVILSEIQPPDALNLSLTCRAAHTVAYPRFLSEVVLGHPWRRTGPDRLLRFCASMLADTSLHVLLLRELTIHKTAFQPKRAASSHGLIDSSAMAFLAEVLKYAVNLRRICIHDTEELLETNPEFRWTLASLPNLQDISFLNAGLRSIDMLISSSSHPRRIDLDLSGLPTDMDAPLVYSTEALEYLMRDVVDVKLSRVTGAMLTIVTDYTWPKVEQLEIFGDLQSLEPFASVYPGLRRLSLVCSYVDDVSAPVRWEALDYLSTSCPVPLEGNVRRVELIYDLDTLLDSVPYSVWAPGSMALLQKTMPVVLACSPNMQILRWIANVVTSVRVLQVYAYQPIHPDVAGVDDVETWLRCHIPVLASAPLVAFTFCRGLSKQVPPSELARLATFIAAQIPSLKYVGWNLNASPKDQWQWHGIEYRWYSVHRVLREGDSHVGPTLTAMSLQDGARVYRRLLDMERS